MNRRYISWKGRITHCKNIIEKPKILIVTALTTRTDETRHCSILQLSYKTLHEPAPACLKDLYYLASFIQYQTKRNQQESERSPIQLPVCGIVCHL